MPKQLSGMALVRSENLKKLKSELKAWNEFTQEITIPNDLAIAFMTGRPEMVKMFKPRPLSAEECKIFLEAISILLETNNELRRHAASLADAVENVRGHMLGLQRSIQDVADFANFRQPTEDDEDDN